MKVTTQRSVSLVLSSGGARGFAHVGVIRALQHHGFRVGAVAGTSMGALVGGIFASGHLDAFQTWARTLDKMEVLKMTDFSISTKGLVKGDRIIRKLKEIVPQRRIEELELPFVAVATDILNGTEVVFREGDLFEAIRASISIPTVFKPVRRGKAYLVDGGLLNPIPVDHIQRTDNDLLVVVDVNAPIPPRVQTKQGAHEESSQHSELIERIRTKLAELIPVRQHEDLGIFNLSNKSIQTMMRRISEFTLEKYRPDLVIRLSRDAFGAFEFYNAEAIMMEGEAIAHGQIAEWLKE